MPLPLFSVHYRVVPETGREDKIEMEIGTWVLNGTCENFEQIRHAISCPNSHHRSDMTPDDPNFFGYLFNRPNNNGTLRLPLEIRKSTLHGHGGCVLAHPLLFAGKWMFSYRPWRGNESRDFATVLNLSLNPTRFVRHQPEPQPMPSANARWPPPSLSMSAAEPQGNGEFSLDGKDNWLPSGSFFETWANPHRWQRHLRNYVVGVAEEFHSQLEHAIDVTSDARLHRVESFTLRKVETYWEFAAIEPTELVRSLIPHLSAYSAGQATISTFPVPAQMVNVNSLSFSVKLTAKLSLRVYAKTNRRVRFEIIQEDLNHRELLGLPLVRRGQPRQPRSGSFNDILRCLYVLRGRASTALNAVLEFLEQHTQVVESQISAFSFLMSIAAALQDRALAHTIVSLLVYHGRIVSREGGADIRDACALLAQAEILAYHPARRVYDVTPPYQYALQMLRCCPAGNLITTARDRTRTRA